MMMHARVHLMRVLLNREIDKVGGDSGERKVA